MSFLFKDNDYDAEKRSSEEWPRKKQSKSEEMKDPSQMTKVNAVWTREKTNRCRILYGKLRHKRKQEITEKMEKQGLQGQD